MTDDTPFSTIRTEQIHVGNAGERLKGTPYRLIEPVGGGGMGQVFRAEHIELGRQVAVKLLAPQLADDAAAMERLRREARAAARIGSAHIVDIYDLGVCDEGRPFVVMKLVDGSDLKTLMDAESPLPPERVAVLLSQIASALRDVHAVGIVHRDLKPENIMIEVRPSGDHTTILDFGIAQSLQDTDTRLTRDGQVIGTPGYMAPEQSLSKVLDGRADQYSLGVIIYEMLAGSGPYPRLSALQLIAASLTQPPTPLSEKVDERLVPPALQAVVMRAISREAVDRFENIQDFAEAFRLALDARVLDPVPPPTHRHGGLLIGIGLVAVAGVGLLFAQTLLSSPADPPGESSPSASVQSAPATRPVGADMGPIIDAAKAKAEPVDAAPDAAIPDAAAPDSAVALQAKAPSPKVQPKRRPKRTKRRPKVAKRPVEKPKPPVEQPKPPIEQPKPPVEQPKPPIEQPKALATVRPTPPVEPPAKPQPAAPSRMVLRFSKVQVSGGTSAKKVRRRVSTVFPKIRACVDAAAPDHVCNGSVSFTIDEDGFFEGFKSTGDTGLARCTATALKRLKKLKRRPDLGDVRVTVGLRLESE